MNNFVWWHPSAPNAEDGVVEFEIPGADPNVKGRSFITPFIPEEHFTKLAIKI